jgi:trimeric autotransporter adhesin
LPALLILSCAPLLAQNYVISTLSLNGFSLNNPTSVALDQASNIYVADWSGFVRKFSIRGDVGTIVAGTGILGNSGDGGPATAASLGRGITITVDFAGNLYLADSDNNRIRKVDATTEIITTVAGTGTTTDSGDGGLGTQAGVSRPSGITVDRAGNLYFSSSWSRVRKLNADTGIIETIAGQSITSFSGDGGSALNALFWDPVPSAVDGSGNIYIADYENSRVRFVNGTTGIVTTLAGSSPCAPSPLGTQVCPGGFAGDGGPATKSLLNYPQAVTLDAAGNIYIADTINHRIRLVQASSHFIFTIGGNGTAGFSGDGGSASLAEIGTPVGIAVDGAGQVYFADEANNRIRVLTPFGAPAYQFLRRPRQ